MSGGSAEPPGGPPAGDPRDLAAAEYVLGTLHFDIDEGRKHNLLNGLDEIGLTLERAPAIDAYEQKIAQRSWA